MGAGGSKIAPFLRKACRYPSCLLQLNLRSAASVQTENVVFRCHVLSLMQLGQNTGADHLRGMLAHDWLTNTSKNFPTNSNVPSGSLTVLPFTSQRSEVFTSIFDFPPSQGPLLCLWFVGGGSKIAPFLRKACRYPSCLLLKTSDL